MVYIGGYEMCFGLWQTCAALVIQDFSCPYLPGLPGFVLRKSRNCLLGQTHQQAPRPSFAGLISLDERRSQESPESLNLKEKK